MQYRLPEILNQGGTPHCSAYAIAGLANFLLDQAGEKTKRVDQVKFYDEVTAKDGDGVTLGQALAKAQVEGLPLVNGGRKFLRYERIMSTPAAIIQALKRAPVAFTYQIPGIGLNEAIKEPDYVLIWPLKTHSMVITGFDKQLFTVANSYGPAWKDKGYFKIPLMYMKQPYCVDVYSLTLIS